MTGLIAISTLNYSALSETTVTNIRNIAEECDLDDYNSAFDLAKKEIKSLKKKMFLTESDFNFIKNNLLTEDLFVIEEYLKKYSEFAP